MVVVVELTAVLVTGILAVTLAGIALLYPAGNVRKGGYREYRDGYFGENTYYSSGKVYGRRWYMELANLKTGERAGKWFRSPLILGRFMGTGEQEKVLYLNQSRTISRRHCMITETEYGLSVENLSEVNRTILNGQYLYGAQPIKKGDVLTLGEEMFKVTSIGRAS